MNSVFRCKTRALFAMLGAFILVFLTSPSGHGQATTGQIIGQVVDPTGAVVPGVAITVTDEQKGITFSGKTDETGNYVVLSLPPSIYSVTAIAPGFAPARYSHATLSIDQHLPLNFHLQMNNVASSIEVTDAPPVLQSTTAEVGTVIGGDAIADLPLAGRNFYALTMLVPGVTAGSSGINALNISVSGQRSYSNSVQMDGIESTTNRTQDVTVHPECGLRRRVQGGYCRLQCRIR